MDDNKQQIIHYFIEEAQEHLAVVEQGLLDLAEVISDAERVNEMFRAAHSVKGGAAMLGFESIQKTAHKLEDCFKILRDHPVPIDRKLETLFLKGYDTLKALVEELANSPNLSLRPEVVEEIVTGSTANFVELQDYLNELLSTSTIEANAKPAETATMAAASNGGGTAVMAPPVNIAGVVTTALQQMLALFKQADSPANRQQLATICQSLAAVGTDITNWQAVVKASQGAIANTNNNYNGLAPIVIRELKQAGDLLAANRGGEIALSPTLQQLVNTAPPAPATTPVATPAPAGTQQITIPVDVRGAAQAILQNFNRQQVTELVVLLHRVISNPKQN
jgi:chemotaxis protein histidine kinase CheA